MTPIAIKVENLGKEYYIHRNLIQRRYSMKELLNTPFTLIRQLVSDENDQDVRETFWALKDVSFEIQHGESVGLVGRNGAGKSTLLKILSRITRPSEGKVTLYERVNSLLEIGTGFNSELTGRDNVYLNGSFLGMKRGEIQRKFDEIVAFSEVEQFIDTPVKYYSSGMFVRLAFSVAAHLTPELLLLDEVLSVGDAGFRQKSTAKMKELLGSGGTIILVSHQENSIKEICQRVIWLDHGKIREDGPTQQVIPNYISSMSLPAA